MNTYLPKAVYSNHNITQQDHNLVCLTPGCKFKMSVEQAKNYIDNKKDPLTIIRNIANNEAKDLKLRVIDKLKSEMVEKGLVQKEALEFFTPFLTTAINPNDSYGFFQVRKELIEKNIDRLNQICPFTAESFENDFLEKKYIDKSKLICTVSANDFTSKPASGFLTQNFDQIKSFLEYLFSTNIPTEVESCITLTKKGSIAVTLEIEAPTDLLEEESYTQHLRYNKKDIESGANGYEAFRNLEKTAIIDTAILKFNCLNFDVCNDAKDASITAWSLAKDYLTISHDRSNLPPKININLTSVVDIDRCEVNIEKFKEALEKKGIQYDDLISETPQEEGYDEVD
jgi:hypothetical protein